MPLLAPETRAYWAVLWLFNLVGLPFDITYSSLLNLAKGGDTAALADQDATQVFAIVTLVLSGLGSIFGVVANFVWQGMLWIEDFKNLPTGSTMWDAFSLTFYNFFDNIIYEGFKPALFFVPVYSMLAVALPYIFYVYDVSD